jgi:hypothetical protein
MAKLIGPDPEGDWDDDRDGQGAPAAPAAETTAATAAVAARVRLLMLISGLTTLVAIAAVFGVVGYRIFHAGGNGAAQLAGGVVALPKGARVIATAVAGDRIVVTLEAGGATEIRTFDVKTLKETGRVKFSTEP